ncbi:MAG TPA: type VI secretion protein ImpB, partial [Thermopetrobacter sp.]|nr:type VI secretion protein ImpB [Thermopetrobacter sp.]
MPDAPLRWLFLDFDSYFAAVEQQEDARLRDRPLVVVPLADTEATGAIAVSRRARALGVRRGMMLAEIRRLCPDVAVRVARHDVYVRWHHRLLDEIARHAPIDMVHSIDELSIRLDKRQRRPARARALGRAIKEGIAARVGVALSCSVGVAPSRLLAKIAAELDKPDGLRLLAGAELPGAIADLPLEELPGISARMSRRLAAAGVRDVAALWRLAPRQARAIWGSVTGERFIRALHGEDVDPPPPRPPASFGHGRVLAPQMRQPPAAWPVACALLLKAAARLRRSGQVAGALLLMVRWQAP